MSAPQSHSGRDGGDAAAGPAGGTDDEQPLSSAAHTLAADLFSLQETLSDAEINALAAKVSTRCL